MAEAIAAIGVVVSAVGLWDSNEKADKRADEQNRLNTQMAANSQAIAAESAKAEAARKKQMDIAAQRERRKLYQQFTVQRALGAARGVASGTSALEGQKSSSFSGMEGQLASQLGEGLGASFKTQSLGTDIFTANQNSFALGSTNTGLQSEYNRVSNSGTDWGATLYTLGSSITNNAKTTNDNWKSLWS